MVALLGKYLVTYLTAHTQTERNSQTARERKAHQRQQKRAVVHAALVESLVQADTEGVSVDVLQVLEAAIEPAERILRQWDLSSSEASGSGDNLQYLRELVGRAKERLERLRSEVHAALEVADRRDDSSEEVQGMPRGVESGLQACANPGCERIESVKREFKKCAQCRVVKYCSLECQLAHWKAEHKRSCNVSTASESSVV